LTKECPYCAEEILVAAKKCKHCGEFLDDELKKNSEPEVEKESVVYVKQEKNGLVTFLVILGIIALIMVITGV